MNIERVVIGMDFSQPALAAARWAARVFQDDVELILVHVLDIPQPPSFLQGSLPPHEELVETGRVGGLERLDELRSALPASRVSTELKVGRAADEIASVAEQVSADLVIVGEHGRRPGIWNVIGSTAERLLHSSPVPVLLARNLSEEAPEAPQRILAAVDGSPSSLRALEWTATLVELFGAQAVLLHVLDPAVVGRVRLISVDRAATAFEEKLRADSRAWLLEAARSGGLREEAIDPIAAVGVAGYEIIAATERNGIDLIVMGSRGAGPFRQRALGSVARAVLRAAACSVLVVVDRD